MKKFPVFSLFNRGFGRPEPESGSPQTASTPTHRVPTGRLRALPAPRPSLRHAGLAAAGRRASRAFRAGGRESDPRDMGLRDDPDTVNAPRQYLKTP